MKKKKRIRKTGKHDPAVIRKLNVQLEILQSLERTALLRAKAKRIRIAEVKRDIKTRSGKK